MWWFTKETSKYIFNNYASCVWEKGKLCVCADMKKMSFQWLINNSCPKFSCCKYVINKEVDNMRVKLFVGLIVLLTGEGCSHHQSNYCHCQCDEKDVIFRSCIYLKVINLACCAVWNAYYINRLCYYKKVVCVCVSRMFTFWILKLSINSFNNFVIFWLMALWIWLYSKNFP